MIRAMRDGTAAGAGPVGARLTARSTRNRFAILNRAPLISWNLWTGAQPPLIILHYRGTRRNAPGIRHLGKHFWVTVENRGE